MTQAAVAKKVGVTKNYITMLESGARVPSLAMLKKVAKALGVPAAERLE